MIEKDVGSVRAVRWEDGELFLLDQRRLPGSEIYLRIDSIASASDAISTMVVRGAPAIGVTAGYAIVLATRKHYLEDPCNWKQLVQADMRQLGDSRPTAEYAMMGFEEGFTHRLPAQTYAFIRSQLTVA